jgi:hypothetical protein
MARRGGYLLLVPGLLIVAVGAIFALAEPSPGEFGNLGQVLAPYILAIGLVPLLVGLAVLRHVRAAQVIGVVVGGVYGAFFVLASMSGNLVTLLLGISFFLGMLALLSAFRAGER